VCLCCRLCVCHSLDQRILLLLPLLLLLLNRVPALIGWVKGVHVISVEWQIALRDAILHVRSRGNKARFSPAMLRAGFKGGRLKGPGPQASHQQGASHQILHIFFVRDMCLAFLIFRLLQSPT